MIPHIQRSRYNAVVCRQSLAFLFSGIIVLTNSTCLLEIFSKHTHLNVHVLQVDTLHEEDIAQI